jgi:nucleoside 2-deoxyribosyltransferase
LPSRKKQQFPPYLLHPELKPSNEPKCPICRTGNATFVRGVVSQYAVGTHGPQYEIFQGWCDTCTNFVITREAVDDARAKKKIPLLCAFLRQLPDKPWEETVGEAVIGLHDWEALASSVTQLGVLEQFDETLVVICRACPAIGQPSTFRYETDWPLVRAESPEAVLFMIRELCNQGFLFKDREGMPQLPPAPTWKAYQKLEELQASGRTSNRAFVAMAFAPSYDDVWLKVIRPAILAAGYNPIRVDKEQHSERIDDFIIAQIRRCRFLVADFTGQRNGVYFEAGFAHGLGRKVIWMCNESEKDKLHFDTRQFNHIMYTDMDQARMQLTDRIVALEDQGTYVPESP